MTPKYPDVAAATSETDDINTLVGVLATDQRRRVLRYFQKSPESVASVDDLVDYLVKSGTQGRTRKREHIQLLQVTLPKLAEADVLAYDGTTEDVRRRETQRWEQASALLTNIQDVA